jgi:hypothetical protein
MKMVPVKRRRIRRIGETAVPKTRVVRPPPIAIATAGICQIRL